MNTASNKRRMKLKKNTRTGRAKNGNKTLKKVYKKKKNGRETYKYYFEREKCRDCPLRDVCIKSAGTVSRILEISVNTPEFYEYSQQQKTDEFKEKYKNRSCQEWK